MVSSDVRWWQFWNPGSGAIGGLIMGMLLTIPLLMILEWLYG